MANIYTITREESNAYHAKKVVDRFLDENGMYSNMGLNILEVPAFLKYNVYAKDLPSDIFATVQKEGQDLTIYVQEGDVTRDVALAVCYILGYEFYRGDDIKKALLHYEEAFDNLFYEKALTKSVKKWYEALPTEEKKAMVEWELKSNADYIIGVGPKELYGDKDKYVEFAEELLSRDHYPRFKIQKQTEPEYWL